MPALKANYLKLRLPGGPVLWSLILLAVAARTGSAIYQGNTVEALPGVFDQISYHQLAMRVLNGHGFSFETGWWPATPANQPTAHWSYLYVLFLSAIYWIAGPNPLVVRLVQAILTGILHPLIAWRLGGRLFSARVGLISAALTSFYAYFVYYAGALVTESLYILAILWALDISTDLVNPFDCQHNSKRLKLWIQLGIALAIAALLRQVILPLTPILLAWIVWQLLRRRQLDGETARSPLHPVLWRLALTISILAASILPWTVRNFNAFHQVVLLNTNAGFAFFWGNHPIHGTEFIPILPGNGSKYGTLIPDELRGLNEAEMDKALLRHGLGFVVEDPKRYLLLSVSRAKEYFKFWPSQDSGVISSYARVLSFGLCLPFLLAGLFLAIFRSGNCHLNDRGGVFFLLLISTLYTLMHLLTWTLVRYRLPVDAITLPFAALALVYAFDKIKRVKRSSDCAQSNTVD